MSTWMEAVAELRGRLDDMERQLAELKAEQAPPPAVYEPTVMVGDVRQSSAPRNERYTVLFRLDDPDTHWEIEFGDGSHWVCHGNIIATDRLISRAKPRRCDTDQGPCACGAWHVEVRLTPEQLHAVQDGMKKAHQMQIIETSERDTSDGALTPVERVLDAIVETCIWESASEVERKSAAGRVIIAVAEEIARVMEHKHFSKAWSAEVRRIARELAVPAPVPAPRDPDAEADAEAARALKGRVTP